MTEDEWLTCRTAPMAMFRHVEKALSGRQSLSLSIECCRLIEGRFVEESARKGWQLLKDIFEPMDVDRIVSQQVVMDELVDSCHRGAGVPVDPQRTAGNALLAAISVQPHGLRLCLEWTLECATSAASPGDRSHARDQVRSRACDLFREIVGNPFRPWKAVPAFLDGGVLQPDGHVVRLTGTALDLAEAIHKLQAFDRLPILADALEESGISDPEILAHCREGTGHVRGCWALDAVRGKS